MGDRPTRSEALKVAHEAVRKVGEGWGTEKIVDALAELWGGFAPEPVEVPMLASLQQKDAAIDTLLRIQVTDSNGKGVTTYLTRKQNEAIAARSNAWEEIKKLLNVGYNQGFSHTARGVFKEAIDLMNRPEMGVGPKST